jgi:hypothetical protein
MNMSVPAVNEWYGDYALIDSPKKHLTTMTEVMSVYRCNSAALG